MDNENLFVDFLKIMFENKKTRAHIYLNLGHRIPRMDFDTVQQYMIYLMGNLN